MGVPYPIISSSTQVQVCALCTVPFYLSKENQQIELQGSLRAQAHSCAWALRCREGLLNRKSMQRSSAARWLEIVFNSPEVLLNTRTWNQHASDSTAKAVNSVILHKIWQQLFDPGCLFIMALAQHLMIFHAGALVELKEKNLFLLILNAIKMRRC